MKRENVVIGALMGLVALLILSALTFQIALMTERPDTIFNFPAQASLLLSPATPVLPTPAPQAAVVVVSTPAPLAPVATANPLPTVPVVPVATLVPVATSTSVPENLPQPTPTAQPTIDVQPQIASIEIQAEVVLHNVNDGLLAGIVQNNPYAIGFMNNASYIPRQADLRVVKLQTDDGRFIEPDAASLTGRTYPLTQPLFLYAAETTLQQKPEVASFISCYLNRVAEEVAQIGYSPINSQAVAQGIINFQTVSATSESAAESGQLLDCAPADAPANNIVVSGSSAIAALNQRMANLFAQEGFAGQIFVNPSDTEAGFRQYCEEGTGGDIVGSSRLIRNDELENCRLLSRNPIMFPVAMDALSIVVSRQNTFVEQLTNEQLYTLFTDAALWSDVDPTWPAEPIIRAIPSITSDSFDFFAKNIFGEAQIKLAATTNTGLLPNSPSTAAPATTTAADVPNQTIDAPAVDTSVADAPAAPAAAEVAPAFDYVFATNTSQPECVLATEIVASVMRDWGWAIGQLTVANTTELFGQLTAEGASDSQAAALTLCYTDPTDREFFRSVANIPQLIGRGYAEIDSGKLYAMARPGIPNEMELTDRCIWNFMRGLSFGDTLQEDQSPAEWLAQNSDLLNTWGSCQGQYRIGVLN